MHPHASTLALVAVTVSLSLAHARGETTWYVDDDNCPGPGSGAEADPFCRIQDGIDAAGIRDTVLVSPGTYYEVIDFNGKFITLRSTAGPDVTTINGAGLPGSVVMCVRGEGYDTVLDGFTITGGSEPYGGGMLNFGSDPTVANCTFRGNRASDGGGMYNQYSWPNVSNCMFSGNRAHRGGAMYNAYSYPRVTDCTFSDNTAGDGKEMYNEYGDPKAPDYHFVAYYAGGGMHNWHSSPRVTDCTFSGNTAAAAGGMCNLDDSNPIVTSCTFSGNTALNGGGMYNEYSNPSVTGCTFSGNSAPYAGGGVLNKYSDPTVINCSFDGNSVYVFGGGMANEYSSPTLANCTFDQNTVRFGGGGGGMANYRSNPTVTNATFSGNTAPHANGGGICNDDSSSSVTNCTFSGNRAANGAAIACDSVQPQYPSTIELVNCILWDGGDQVWNNDNSSITITFSDVQGGWPNDDCPVEYPDCNFDADPLFVPGPEGCYYLSQTAAGQPIDSPCLDAGSDTAENLALDTLTTRSDEVGDAGVVDMGYHYPVTGQPLIMGDYNRDLVVDLADFAALQNCFTGEGPTDVTPCCRIFDFEPDNDVDLDDYDQFEVAFNP